jgi:hypothetical protein
MKRRNKEDNSGIAVTGAVYRNEISQAASFPPCVLITCERGVIMMLLRMLLTRQQISYMP